MPRITVAIFPDNSRTFSIQPYEPINWANVIYYPEVPQDILDQILKANPQDVEKILSKTANI